MHKTQKMTYHDHDLNSIENKIILYATEEGTIHRAEVEVKKFLESEAESNAWFFDNEKLLISIPTCQADYDPELDQFFTRTLAVSTLTWEQFQKHFKRELTQKIEMFTFLYDTEINWEETDMKPEQTLEEEARRAWMETRI